MAANLEQVWDEKATLGEGPVWDEATSELVWVDILENKVHRLNLDSREHRSIDAGQHIGAIALGQAGGEAVVALHHGLYRLNEETGEKTFIGDPEADYPSQRFNDGKCDARGRFWAGTMPMEGDAPVGKLYRLDPDGTIVAAEHGIGCSNGIAWSLDNSTMYYIDSPTRNVYAYDFDLEQGTISNRRTIITFAEDDGVPDGMTNDAEGHLWIAHWGGACVTRWDPREGKLLEKVEIPALQVTSCAFGSADFSELYITSASVGLTDEQLAQYPGSGCIFRLKTNTRGLPFSRFG